jgi:hypothetical protein
MQHRAGRRVPFEQPERKSSDARASREVVCDGGGDGLVELRGRGILVQTGVQVLYRVLGVGTGGGRSSSRSRSGGIVGTAIVMIRSRHRRRLYLSKQRRTGLSFRAVRLGIGVRHTVALWRA